MNPVQEYLKLRRDLLMEAVQHLEGYDALIAVEALNPETDAQALAYDHLHEQVIDLITRIRKALQ